MRERNDEYSVDGVELTTESHLIRHAATSGELERG